MKIIDIQHSKTGETRTDGRYPLRIGSEVRFYTNLCVGDIMALEYIKDNQGNAKDGILHTSRIERIDRTKGKIIVTTRNSIYHFEVDHPTEKVCTGERCPMQVGYDVKNCKDKDCIYRTETEKGGGE